MDPSLTILTVSYQSEDLVRFGVSLSERLNPGTSQDWLIVDNTTTHQPGWNFHRPADSALKVRVIAGRPQPTQTIDGDKGSLHHADALTHALSEVQTRYLLVIDPDFFPLRNHWIRDVLHRMQSEELHFFGATWDPTQIVKYQGFPCVHFMLIDLQRVDKTLLRFWPQPSKRYKTRAWLKRVYRKAPLDSKLFPWLHLTRTLFDRMASRDTGFQIYDRFANKPGIRAETLEFVVDRDRESLYQARFHLGPKRSRRALQKWLYPKSPSLFFSQVESARELEDIAPDFKGKGLSWDEFWWQGAPFGVHLRRVSQTVRQTCHLKYNDQSQWAELAARLVEFKRAQFADPVSP